MQTHAGNCDIIKNSAGDRPPMTRDFNSSWRRLSRGAQPVIQGWAITRFVSFAVHNEACCRPNFGKFFGFVCDVISQYLTSGNLILKRKKISIETR